MFDSEQTPGAGCGEHTGGTDYPERRQYTIKGIENDAIELMRDAARKDGMKIGAWISCRMKEAAFKSLGATSDLRRSGHSMVRGPASSLEAEVLAASLQEFDQRLRQIEAELHQITKSQRTIMARMLENV